MNMSKIDMTQGSILGRAAQFALPICIGNILQQLYGTVDTLVIGNFCDASALAAVPQVPSHWRFFCVSFLALVPEYPS